MKTKIKDQKSKCKTVEPRPTRWAGDYFIKKEPRINANECRKK